MKWEDGIIDSLAWGKEITRREEKESVALRLAAMVKDGDVLGVGSGSTSVMGIRSI